MAAIREVFSSGEQRDEDEAIREVACALGFQRTGPRIRKRIKRSLLTAIERGVIRNGDGVFGIDCRNIGDYSRDQLIAALLGAMGSRWWDREEAIRAAARHLGFRRTGSPSAMLSNRRSTEQFAAGGWSMTARKFER